MGTWNWDDVPHQKHPMSEATEPVQLAAKLACLEIGSQNFEAEAAALIDLPFLGLIEWGAEDYLPETFAILKEAGSIRGFVVDEGEKGKPADFFRSLDLTDQIARAIQTDDAMNFPMVFVDDQQLCVMASFYSDYALIAMRSDLLDQLVTLEEFDLTMWASEPTYPAPRDHKHAQELAQRRLKSWDDHWSQSRSKT
ncbi:MAG: hypothetical protein ABJE00_04365 [Erythrobacter sp.]